MEVQRLRWAWHIAFMAAHRAHSMLFRNNPEGRRGKGRPIMRCMDGVEADVRALGIRGWQSAAIDQMRWSQIID